MMRRLTVVLIGIAAMLLTAIPIAIADDDLADYLQDAADAPFHGMGVVVCTWGTESAGATYEVTRSDGMSMVHGPNGELMAIGATTATRSGADWYGLEVEEWAAWSLSDRYRLSEPQPTFRLGRRAVAVTVMEGEIRRANLIIDEESTVPLITEILDGDGNVFRMAVLIDFAPGPQPMPDDMPEMHEMTMVARAPAPGRIPTDLAGYARADTYRGEEGTLQAFYTDGLFSFSLFETERTRRLGAFEDASRFVVAGNEYRRIVTPSEVWVQWNAPDYSYVLVGDLPPDHIAEVLQELPAPGDRGFWVRLWRRLFG
jgi:hypothetical protein